MSSDAYARTKTLAELEQHTRGQLYAADAFTALISPGHEHHDLMVRFFEYRLPIYQSRHINFARFSIVEMGILENLLTTGMTIYQAKEHMSRVYKRARTTQHISQDISYIDLDTEIIESPRELSMAYTLAAAEKSQYALVSFDYVLAAQRPETVLIPSFHPEPSNEPGGYS